MVDKIISYNLEVSNLRCDVEVLSCANKFIRRFRQFCTNSDTCVGSTLPAATVSYECKWDGFVNSSIT